MFLSLDRQVQSLPENPYPEPRLHQLLHYWDDCQVGIFPRVVYRITEGERERELLQRRPLAALLSPYITTLQSPVKLKAGAGQPSYRQSE
jgi:hypothetical protein